mgnify:CR=1 FL=1
MAVAQRRPGNPLALAVLSLLNERPMHPYEIGSTMRERRMSDTIKLNTGSLYAVIESLLRGGWIEPVATEREGRHPERTIYAPTEAGKELFFSWLRSLIGTPVKEYPQFAAGLSLLGHLPPGEAQRLLEERLSNIDRRLDAERASRDAVALSGVDRLFLIEMEYSISMMEAERRWVEKIIGEIRDGTLSMLWGRPAHTK